VIGRALLVAALLGIAAPGSAGAQVFIAGRPDPGFEIGPLFVRANVTPALASITVDVSWSLAIPPGRTAAGSDDLLLLWPSAIVADPALGAADPALEPYVEARGLDPIDGGRVAYAARPLYGADPARWEPIAGGASFVTYVRTGGMGLTSPASLIRIPWDPRLVNRAFLMRLTFPTKGLLRDKPGTWMERALWGPRQRLTLSFNEVRHRALFPIYFEHRDRVVRLSEDPAQLLMEFADSPRLRVDEMLPASARRQLSETREQTDTVSLYLDRGDGLIPQVLSVQFGYFTGLQSWAPILIPLGIFVAGNIGGVLIRTAAERVTRRWAGRFGLWRQDTPAAARETGVVVDASTLAKILPGVTTSQQVRELCGHDVEERVSLGAPERRTLVYRGRRIVPHRRRLAGVLAAVTHWDVEDHETQIVVDREVVQDVQAQVRRSRLTGADPAG
jgi:hypothetical protein